MKNWLAGLFTAMVLLPAWVGADTLVLREDVPQRYVVERGDTLWNIANLFLNDPWRWEDIWWKNPQVDNPDLIFPGDVLYLTTVDGRPRLSLGERGLEANTVRLSPTVRVEPLAGAISTVPRELISSFLNRSLILSEVTLEDAAYVVRGDDGRLLLGQGDYLYARGDWGDERSVYEVFRRGETYTDQETGQLLGIEAIALGLGELELSQGDIGRVQLTQSQEDVRVGDRLVQVPRAAQSSSFLPAVPPLNLTGEILNVATGGQHIGQFDVVLLSRGQEHGIMEGHVFDVVRPGAHIRDPLNNDRLQLPEQRVGTLMVFRTFDRLSYGLILNAVNTIKLGDAVRSPETASMP
ncbi:MAG: LysM domain-containing protein [Natronospirillum sp.]